MGRYLGCKQIHLVLFSNRNIKLHRLKGKDKASKHGSCFGLHPLFKQSMHGRWLLGNQNRLLTPFFPMGLKHRYERGKTVCARFLSLQGFVRDFFNLVRLVVCRTFSVTNAPLGLDWTSVTAPGLT